VELDIGEEGGDGGVKAVEKGAEGSLEVGDDSLEVSSDIGSNLRLERYNVGDGGESNVGGLRVGGD